MSTRDKRPVPGQPRRSSGVALGVLGIMLLAFFAIVFMLGRPSYRHQFEEFIHHPFDPHPIGIDKRHKDASLTDIKLDAGATAITSSTTTETEKKSSGRTAATPSPSPEVEDKKAEEKKAAEKEAEVKKAAEEKKAEEKKAEEKKAEEKKAEEKKAEEKKAEEKKAEAKKAEEKKAEEKKAETAVVAKAGGDDADDDGKITELDTKYKPTREMVQKIAQGGYLMVTWANYHYFDFVKTWVTHVKRVGVTGYIVGAMDDHLLREMIKLEYNCFSMKSGLTLGDFGWGSSTFAKMGREKIRLISIFLKLDVNVVIADVDVLWLRNPLPYFDRYPEADILTSSDNMANTVKDESLEKWPDAGAAANIGIMLFRKKSLDFVEKWIEIIEADDKIWDQNAFNDLFRRGVKPLEPPNKNLFLGYDGSLTMGILPVSIFCSGHTMYVQRMGQRLGLQPYAVHGTFQFSGTPGKRHRMREFMLYDDPPEYYDHPVGFVSFDLDGLPELLKDAGPATNGFGLDNVQGHFKLVNHELQRLRQGFAIASVITGRALVVPELWAGLDRWWAPHSGRIPGAHFDLPFVAPLDHMLDLENGMFRKFPEEHYGPSTDFREYSFFNNSRMTPAVRDSKVLVEVCAAAAADCSDGSKPAQVVTEGAVKKVKIAPGLSSAALATALSDPAVKGAKVLHFNTMAGFNFPQAFSEPGASSRFIERMKLYGSIWCCVLAHPGHIHYDLLWDMPHTDKFQRVWNGTWETKTGP